MNPYAYVLTLVRFAFRANPRFHLAVVLTLASALIELLAMACLLPMVTLVSGAAPRAPDVVSRALAALGLPVTAQSLFWIFLVLLTARLATLLVAQTLSASLGRRVMAQIGSTAFTQVVGHLPLPELQAKSIGHFIGLAGEEAFRASVVLIALVQFVGTSVLGAMYFLGIAHYSPPAAGVVLAFLAIAALAGRHILAASRRLGERQVAQSREANSVFLDAMNNVKAVRAAGAETYIADIYRDLVFAYSRTWFWIDELAVLTRLVPVLLLMGVVATWLALSANSFAAMGLPFVVTLIAFFMRLFPTLGQAVNLFMRLAAETRSGKDINELLSRPLPVHGAGVDPGPVQRIEARALGFRHAPGAVAILDDLDLTFERGHAYAVTGGSGTGKSTLADLMLKFQDPTAGAIRVNGQPLASLDEVALRRRIALVGQDAAIFNVSIADNIRLGMPVPLAAVKEACRRTGIHDFIENLADGYATPLHYHGRNLSGGQRQRIILARALLRDPDVLVLDESTNALDRQSQERIADDLLAAFADRILIWITHDPSLMARVGAVVDLAERRSPAGAA